MTMNVSWKINMLLGSKDVRISLNLLACPFELSRCKLKSPIYTNCHGVELVHLTGMYRFEAYTGRQQNY